MPTRQQLYVVDGRETLLLLPWNELGAWVYEDGSVRRWRKRSPLTNLWRVGLEPRAQARQPPRSPWRRYFATIPDDTRLRAARFYERHWSVLMFERWIDGAPELVATNPALGFALANHDGFASDPVRMQRMCSLAARRRREILNALGFPRTESAARTLGKIPPETVTIERLSWLRQLLRADDPEVMQLLAHVPRLNSGVLEIVRHRELRELATPRLLAEIAHREDEDAWPSSANLLASLRSHCPDLLRRRRAPKIASLTRLAELLAEVRWQRLVTETSGAAADFPDPPFPSRPGVRALRTPAEVVRAGRELDNCLSRRSTALAYVKQARRGLIVLYAFDQPEPGLACLVKGERSWSVREFEGAHGAPPAKALHDVALEWTRACAATTGDRIEWNLAKSAPSPRRRPQDPSHDHSANLPLPF